MDRNSAIGLTLIAILLLVYFNFFATQPTPPAPPATVKTDTTGRTAARPTSSTDSVAAVASADAPEEITEIENADLRISFSNRGYIRQLELKKFKAYNQSPLLLVSPTTNRFALRHSTTGDLYQVPYQASQSRVADTVLLTYTGSVNGITVRHVYEIPPSGYEIHYRLHTSGGLSGDFLTLEWNDDIPLQEKDMTDSRNKTSINYYTVADGFDGLSDTSDDSETLSNPLKWVTIKQKFFLSSIITDGQFTGGEFTTLTNPTSTTTVKTANVRLFIPTREVNEKGSHFRYYFGPNDYKITSDVTGGFSRNLYLGIPPMIWVNKFVIIPIFKFLETFIGNYGLIIVIMVLIIKLILTPLSYKSYLGMAKMRLLKPELDLIKEKYGDNMAQIQQEQLKLYQQAGVNPFSGCIPVLLQMPILIAMFYFFPISIELRQEPFLWAEDLSTYDSIINLPFTIPFYGAHVSLFTILMTASTLVYTWQNNQISSVTGPMKSLSYIMPVAFMFILNSFSAGLSFYYFVSNLVTFAQQAIIKRFVDEGKILQVMDEHKKKMAAGGPSKKSKFMTKLEEAMKASQEARKASEDNKKKKGK
ncbi:MAG: membrane protein insertase YidC [Cyclobacteriaceae bacterium]|jgi:YidC/Oxa1 family membrane protein insertase